MHKFYSPAPPDVHLSHNYPTSLANQRREFVIRCRFISLTRSNVKLYHNETLLKSEDRRQSGEMVMLISKFDVDNVGSYKCVVNNGIGENSSEFKIDIRLAPVVKVEPNSMTVKEGNMIKLKCEISGIREESVVLWKNHNKVIKEILKVNEKSVIDYLEIKVSEYDHRQNVSCEIKDGFFEVSAEAEISVEYPPKFRTGISSELNTRETFDIGKEVKLECDTDENPEGTVKWSYYKDANYNVTFKNLNHSTKVYEIPEFNKTMRGNYVCEVENKHGKAKKQIKVLARPVSKPFIERISKVIVNESETLMLECSCTDCLPITNNYWLDPYEKSISKTRINNTEENKADKFTSTLYYKGLRKAKQEDSGLYKCYFQNKEGDDLKSIHVVVQYKPTDIVILANGNYVNLKYEINDFKDFEINCSSPAIPQSKITILKNGQIISENAKLIFKREDIMNAIGDYQFISENELGSISREIEIDVKIPPKIMRKLEKKGEKVAKNESEIIELFCDIDGIPRPEIEWKFEKNELNENHEISKDGKTLRFVLNEKTRGTYQCIGDNGLTKTSAISFFVNMNGENLIL